MGNPPHKLRGYPLRGPSRTVDTTGFIFPLWGYRFPPELKLPREIVLLNVSHKKQLHLKSPGRIFHFFLRTSVHLEMCFSSKLCQWCPSPHVKKLRDNFSWIIPLPPLVPAIRTRDKASNLGQMFVWTNPCVCVLSTLSFYSMIHYGFII